MEVVVNGTSSGDVSRGCIERVYIMTSFGELGVMCYYGYG